MTEYTKDQIIELADRYVKGHWIARFPWERVNAWLARGDGIAVYQNADFDSSTFGDLQLLSFGSADAQLETDTPPEQRPDGVSYGLGWRYRLRGTYRGEPIEEPVDG